MKEYQAHTMLTGADSGFTAVVAVRVVGGVGASGLHLPLGEGVASGLG